MSHSFRLLRHALRLLGVLPALISAGAAQAAFTDHGNGTVSDPVTGLMWDKCSWGQSNITDCSGGAASTHDWAAALGVALTANAASHRGYGDWRLPNINELESLVKIDASNPAIDGTAFPNTQSSYYVSSTLGSSGRWNVHFAFGRAIDPGISGHVRLVRGGQSLASFDSLDTIPAAFAFTELAGQAPNSLLVSNGITVSGVTTAVPISVTGGEYRIGAGTWTSADGTVNNGETVSVRHTTSAAFSTSVDTVLTVGSGPTAVSATFRSTTEALDDIPAPFFFTDLPGRPQSTLVTSNAVTVSGINVPVTIRVLGGEYRIGSGAWTSADGTANVGDMVTVRHTTGAGMGVTVNTMLALGSVVDTFSSTTETPAIPVDGACGAAQGVLTRDMPVFQLCSAGYGSGVSAGTATFSWSCYGWSGGSTATCSAPRAYVVLPLAGVHGRLDPAIAQTLAYGATATLTALPDAGYIVQSLNGCGGTRSGNRLTTASLSADCTVIASFAAGDATPDPFAFAAQSGVSVGTLVSSNVVTVSGIDIAAPVRVSGGEYRIGDGGWLGADGSVKAGDRVQVRHVSSPEHGRSVMTVLEIGGVSGQFSSTTRIEDDTPDSFAFAPLAGVAPDALVTSTPVVVSGIDVPVLVTVSGGSYAVDDGEFTQAPGVLHSGQRVRAQVRASSAFSGTATAVVSIGGGSGNFTVTTHDGASPLPFAFNTVRHAGKGTVYESNTVTLSGLSGSKPLTVSGGEVSLGGGAWTSAGTASAGTTVKVRQTSSASPGRRTRAIVTVGATSGSFDVITGGGISGGILQLLLD